MKTLSLVNQIEDAKEILQKAIEFAKDDILEVMFVHEDSIFSLPELFKPEFETDENIDKEKIKNEIKAILKELNYTKDVAIFVYVNDTISRVEATQSHINPLIVTKLNDATKELLHTNFNLLYTKNSNYNHIAAVVKLDESDINVISFIKENLQKEPIVFYDYQHNILIESAAIDPILTPTYDPSIDVELTKINKQNFEEFLKTNNLKGFFIEDYGEYKNLIDLLNCKSFDLLVTAIRDEKFLEFKKDIIFL